MNRSERKADMFKFIQRYKGKLSLAIMRYKSLLDIENHDYAK